MENDKLIEQLTKQNEYNFNESLKWQERAQDLASKVAKLETELDQFKVRNALLTNEISNLKKGNC